MLARSSYWLLWVCANGEHVNESECAVRMQFCIGSETWTGVAQSKSMPATEFQPVVDTQALIGAGAGLFVGMVAFAIDTEQRLKRRR